MTSSPAAHSASTGQPADDPARRADIAARAKTRISPETGLSTDFLNQYNELTMVLQVVGDCPDELDWVADWRPRSYAEHFERSGFADVDLLLAGYALTPACLRRRFDDAVAQLNRDIAVALGPLLAIAPAQRGALGPAADALANEINLSVMQLSGLMNGPASTSQQDAIDALFD